MAGAPPQVGGVTPRALEVGVSKKHPTTLLLFYVLPKILSLITDNLFIYKTILNQIGKNMKFSNST